MGYKGAKIIMKKFFIMLFAALAISLSANAETAFCAPYESIEVTISKAGKSVFLDNSVISHYSVNPYKNSNMCAPNMNWATCFDYCFSYNGKTYYFNLQD